MVELVLEKTTMLSMEWRAGESRTYISVQHTAFLEDVWLVVVVDTEA